MTRRSMLYIATACTGELVGCQGHRNQLFSALGNLEKREGLAILGPELTAFLSSGTVVGRTSLSDCCTAMPGISPDGGCIAWTPRPSPGSSVSNSVVLAKDGIHETQRIRYQGRFGSHVAIASNAATIALVSVLGQVSERRLIVIRRSDHLREDDVTSLLTSFAPSNIERIRLSVSGERLAIGSRESFVVVDLSSGVLLFKGSGRFPALSPDGVRLAFVTEKGLLTLVNLANAEIKSLITSCRTYGVGAWSPDGGFLLAGVKPPLSLWRQLVAVDPIQNEFVKIIELNEGSYGSEYAWVKRRLLSER